MTNSGQHKEVKGHIASQDEIDEMTELRTFFKPEDGRKRLEEFAKWLFGGTTAVATLGAGFSIAGTSQLAGLGKLVFVLAVICVGFSLACAAMSIAPKWVEINRNSLDSMRAAVSKQFVSRKRWLSIASASFAIGLFLAASSPLATSISAGTKSEPVRVQVTYSMEDSGKFEAQLVAVGLAPYVPVEVELATMPMTKGIVLPKRRGLTDAEGAATLQLVLQKVTKIKGTLVVNSRWKESAEKMRQETLEIPIGLTQKS